MAAGDVSHDGSPELVVAAGFGGEPRTAIFIGQSVFAGSPVRLVGDFFAFPGSDTTNLRNGAYVAVWGVTGDGFADLVFGGPGGAPRVFVLSGALVSAGEVTGAQADPAANFFVGGDRSDRGGARVAVTNSDGDGRAEVAVGSGAGRPAQVRVYQGKDSAVWEAGRRRPSSTRSAGRSRPTGWTSGDAVVAPRVGPGIQAELTRLLAVHGKDNEGVGPGLH